MDKRWQTEFQIKANAFQQESSLSDPVDGIFLRLLRSAEIVENTQIGRQYLDEFYSHLKWKFRGTSFIHPYHSTAHEQGLNRHGSVDLQLKNSPQRKLLDSRQADSSFRDVDAPGPAAGIIIHNPVCYFQIYIYPDMPALLAHAITSHL